MSSLQDLLNPVSSGPPSPVARVPSRLRSPSPPSNTQEAASTLAYFASSHAHQQFSPQLDQDAAAPTRDPEVSDTDTVESSSPALPISLNGSPAVDSPPPTVLTNGFGHGSSGERDATEERDEDYEMGGIDEAQEDNAGDRVEESRLRSVTPTTVPEPVRLSPLPASASPQSDAAPTPADTTTVNTPVVGTPVASTGKTKKSKAARQAAPRKKGTAKQQKKKRKAAADGDDDLEDEMVTKKRQVGRRARKRESEAPSGYNTETDDQVATTRGGSPRRDTTPPQPSSPEIPPSPTERYDETGAELYCICRKPDSGKWMIACDGACDDWYHGECVKVAEEDGNLIDKYYCRRCTYRGCGKTTWKRKCRLVTCRQAADVSKRPHPSKYCSDAHGVEFFETQLQSDRLRYTLPEVNTIASAASSGTQFRRLGDRMPTPPMSDENWRDYPEESQRLTSIAREKAALRRRGEANEDRAQYTEWAMERARRIHDEMKADPDIKHTGKEICGFDERLALDDGEWESWRASAEGQATFEKRRINGREGVCVKKKCEKHFNWKILFADDCQLQERLVGERLVQLKHEERNIKDRQKRRSIRDNTEGVAESGPWLMGQ